MELNSLLLMLAHLITFQFIYPAYFRAIVPQWVYQDLLKRMETQLTSPDPVRKVCLGPLIDQWQYNIDVEEWGYGVIDL